MAKNLRGGLGRDANPNQDIIPVTPRVPDVAPSPLDWPETAQTQVERQDENAVRNIVSMSQSVGALPAEAAVPTAKKIDWPLLALRGGITAILAGVGLALFIPGSAIGLSVLFAAAALLTMGYTIAAGVRYYATPMARSAMTLRATVVVAIGILLALLTPVDRITILCIGMIYLLADRFCGRQGLHEVGEKYAEREE